MALMGSLDARDGTEGIPAMRGAGAAETAREEQARARAAARADLASLATADRVAMKRKLSELRVKGKNFQGFREEAKAEEPKRRPWNSGERSGDGLGLFLRNSV